MQRKKTGWALSCGMAALAAAGLHYAQSSGATTASGFSGATLASGQFAEFEVFNHLTARELQKVGTRGKVWLSLQKTKGASDVYVQSNTWQPGATTGWHRHPGHSLIIITSGQVTQYHEDCTVEVYGPGTENGPTLVDTGNHAHVIRNEGTTVATGFAVQIVASGATRRIDVPEPPTDCPVY